MNIYKHCEKRCGANHWLILVGGELRAYNNPVHTPGKSILIRSHVRSFRLIMPGCCEGIIIIQPRGENVLSDYGSRRTTKRSLSIFCIVLLFWVLYKESPNLRKRISMLYVYITIVCKKYW